jgi:hypothetical protein
MSSSLFRCTVYNIVSPKSICSPFEQKNSHRVDNSTLTCLSFPVHTTIFDLERFASTLPQLELELSRVFNPHNKKLKPELSSSNSPACDLPHSSRTIFLPPWDLHITGKSLRESSTKSEIRRRRRTTRINQSRACSSPRALSTFFFFFFFF